MKKKKGRGGKRKSRKKESVKLKGKKDKGRVKRAYQIADAVFIFGVRVSGGSRKKKMQMK